MSNYPQEFKERVENLFNNSVISLLLGNPGEKTLLSIDGMDNSLVTELLQERSGYIENFLSPKWLEKMPCETGEQMTFKLLAVFRLTSELNETKALLEKHQKNITLGLYFN